MMRSKTQSAGFTAGEKAVAKLQEIRDEFLVPRRADAFNMGATPPTSL